MTKKLNPIGDCGEFFVGYFITKELKCAYRPLKFSDIGIDGEIELFEGNSTLNKIIKVQVKSSELEGNKQVSCKDVFYWKALFFPVIIIYADLKNSKLFYYDVSSIVIPTDSKPESTITLNYTNEITDKSLSELVVIVEEFEEKYTNTFDLIKVQSRFTTQIDLLRKIIKTGMRLLSNDDGIGASRELMKARQKIQDLKSASTLAFGEGKVIKGLLVADRELSQLSEDIHDHSIDGIY